jgi:hypothetical protein
MLWLHIRRSTDESLCYGYTLDVDAWGLHQVLPLEGSREAYNPHQAVYLIVVV